MAGDDEQILLSGEDGVDGWIYGVESNDKNVNSNLIIVQGERLERGKETKTFVS
uniref:Uncharacterized protein n=1 Tax=Rhizophora mucronata TaxID=61149 RepID=A0A2P2N3R0_RHIMU